MSDTYKLLDRVLFEVEENIKNKITTISLAKTVALASVQFQRLFRLAFETPITSYIRSRKLAASLESLLKMDFKVIDIAKEYGFTPNEARSAGHIISITNGGIQ